MYSYSHTGTLLHADIQPNLVHFIVHIVYSVHMLQLPEWCEIRLYCDLPDVLIQVGAKPCNEWWDYIHV